MKTTITARHFELTEAIKQHINDKVVQYDSHFSEALEAAFILDIEAKDYVAEANVHIRGEVIHSKISTEDMYKSIDSLIHKLVSLLDKNKDKHKNPPDKRIRKVEPADE
ncbi:MAG: ribosome-associated translation inhibitor RaiA [Candidatus Caenarcaniphilales bacterium]|nr:ribosome-associated translation inhibitor RaiA [Candidatus Caenarcaniphilales bacterium]